MKIQKQYLIVPFTLGALLSGCNGGSDGGGSDQPLQVTPSVNVAKSIQSFFDGNGRWQGLTATDTNDTKVNFFIGSEELYPFVSSGNEPETVSVKRLQLQFIDNKSGKLAEQYIWKLHLDSTGKPTGLAVAQELFNFDGKPCFSSSNAPSLPASSNGSGSYLVGTVGSYDEGFRNGKYAHYCEVTSNSVTEKMVWSVDNGSPNPYVCLTMPFSYMNLKTKICVSTASDGTLTNSMWIRTYSSSNALKASYRDQGQNSPL